MLILSQLEKIPTQRDQKQLHINVRRREEGKTLEDKSQVYIIYIACLLTFFYLNFKEEK